MKPVIRRGSTVPARVVVWSAVVATCAACLVVTGCSLESGEDGSSEPSVSVPVSVTPTSLEAQVTSTTTTAPAAESDAESDALGDEVDGLLRGLSDDNDAADKLEDVSELD